jgi:RNA polymerase sigma-70 factor, Bacteroides expansion family 1
MSFTDLELLSRIKKSDEKAFETLFRTYYKSLCLFAYKILKDNVTAEEIVQDIFYYVWEKREDLELTTSVKSYLFKSVYNNSLKNIRHQKIVKNYEAKAIIEGPSFELQENYAEIGEMMHVIQLTLEQVPERTREIFELNRNEGLKYQEISEKLNISIKTVEAHMTSILKQFRENLKDYMMLLLLFLIGYLP